MGRFVLVGILRALLVEFLLVSYRRLAAGSGCEYANDNSLLTLLVATMGISLLV